MKNLNKDSFSSLPHWDVVAFITRCAKRLLPLYENEESEPAGQRLAVKQAIQLAEKRSAIGGKLEEVLDEPIKLGEQCLGS